MSADSGSNGLDIQDDQAKALQIDAFQAEVLQRVDAISVLLPLADFRRDSLVHSDSIVNDCSFIRVSWGWPFTYVLSHIDGRS